MANVGWRCNPGQYPHIRFAGTSGLMTVALLSTRVRTTVDHNPDR